MVTGLVRFGVRDGFWARGVLVGIVGIDISRQNHREMPPAILAGLSSTGHLKKGRKGPFLEIIVRGGSSFFFGFRGFWDF